LDDLSGGQTGRIEFNSKTPDHRWALVRGRLGSDTPIFGDLLMPANAQGKVPAVVFSHGSEGLSSLYFDVWAKALNAAGYAVFVVDSFKPRNEERVTGASKQLTWNTTANMRMRCMPSSCWRHIRRLIASHLSHGLVTWRSRSGCGMADLPAARCSCHVKWAGSIAVYPGCNMRYRVDQHSKLPSPLLMLLGEKDDMTLPKPCMELADELAVNGNPVTYKVYVGATHVFDRLNQKWAQYREGNYNKCSMDVRMPYGAKIVLGARHMTSIPARPLT
jgi:dienelactone hydrolase